MGIHAETPARVSIPVALYTFYEKWVATSKPPLLKTAEEYIVHVLVHHAVACQQRIFLLDAHEATGATGATVATVATRGRIRPSNAMSREGQAAAGRCKDGHQASPAPLDAARFAIGKIVHSARLPGNIDGLVERLATRIIRAYVEASSGADPASPEVLFPAIYISVNRLVYPGKFTFQQLARAISSSNMHAGHANREEPSFNKHLDDFSGKLCGRGGHVPESLPGGDGKGRACSKCGRILDGMVPAGELAGKAGPGTPRGEPSWMAPLTDSKAILTAAVPGVERLDGEVDRALKDATAIVDACLAAPVPPARIPSIRAFIAGRLLVKEKVSLARIGKLAGIPRSTLHGSIVRMANEVLGREDITTLDLDFFALVKAARQS